MLNVQGVELERWALNVKRSRNLWAATRLLTGDMRPVRSLLKVPPETFATGCPSALVSCNITTCEANRFIETSFSNS